MADGGLVVIRWKSLPLVTQAAVVVVDLDGGRAIAGAWRIGTSIGLGRPIAGDGVAISPNFDIVDKKPIAKS